MAWLEQKDSGTFHVVFRISEEKYRRSLKTKLHREALSRKLRIEENLKLVETGRLTVPDDADLVSFLLSDGKLNGKISGQKRLPLGKLFSTFVENLPEDSMEANSLATASVHMRHIVRIIGSRIQLRTITIIDLQRYVNHRSKEPGYRGRNASAATIKKELATLRSIWNWSKQHGYVASELSLKGVVYPKQQERPPFRTRKEIERQISVSNFNENQEKELWECLYLRSHEIKEILAVIEQQSNYPHVYPMVALAAYTGMRRSEICRSIMTDIDLAGRSILVREKKRNKAKRTFRQVPLTTELAEILSDWFRIKPPGQATFPSMLKANRNSDAVTPTEATDHLEQAVRHSKWEVISGWHVFRHSFISNCASCGIDQRMIDDWVGHQTDEQRKRYRHLFPDTQKREIDRVF